MKKTFPTKISNKTRAQRQKFDSTVTEIDSYKKSIIKEQEKNESLTLITNQRVSEIKNLDKSLQITKDRMDTLQQEYSQFNRALKETEAKLTSIKLVSCCSTRTFEFYLINTVNLNYYNFINKNKKYKGHWSEKERAESESARDREAERGESAHRGRDVQGAAKEVDSREGGRVQRQVAQQAEGKARRGREETGRDRERGGAIATREFAEAVDERGVGARVRLASKRDRRSQPHRVQERERDSQTRAAHRGQTGPDRFV